MFSKILADELLSPNSAFRCSSKNKTTFLWSSTAAPLSIYLLIALTGRADRPSSSPFLSWTCYAENSTHWFLIIDSRPIKHGSVPIAICICESWVWHHGFRSSVAVFCLAMMPGIMVVYLLISGRFYHWVWRGYIGESFIVKDSLVWRF